MFYDVYEHINMIRRRCGYDRPATKHRSSDSPAKNKFLGRSDEGVYVFFADNGLVARHGGWGRPKHTPLHQDLAVHPFAGRFPEVELAGPEQVCDSLPRRSPPLLLQLIQKRQDGTAGIVERILDLGRLA